MTHASFAITYDLHFNMVKAIGGGFFGNDSSRRTFSHGPGYGIGKLCLFAHKANTASAAAVDSFDHDRQIILRKVNHCWSVIRCAL